MATFKHHLNSKIVTRRSALKILVSNYVQDLCSFTLPYDNQLYTKYT